VQEAKGDRTFAAICDSINLIYVDMTITLTFLRTVKNLEVDDAPQVLEYASDSSEYEDNDPGPVINTQAPLLLKSGVFLSYTCSPSSLTSTRFNLDFDPTCVYSHSLHITFRLPLNPLRISCDILLHRRR